MLERSREVAPVAAIALVAAAASAITAALESPAMDFWHFRAVPLAVQRGVTGDLYGPAGREAIFRATVEPHLKQTARAEALTREGVAALQSAGTDVEFLGYRGVETLSTPALFAAFSLLSRGSYDADQALYAVVSVLAFLVSVLALALVSGFRLAYAVLLAGLLGLVFEPFASELRVGNVNALQLGMITAVVALLARQRLMGGGAVLGAATLFKPTVAVVAVVVAIALATGRSWRWLARFAAGGALGACVAVAATWMYFESLAPWGDWLAILPEVAATRRTLEAGNYSPAALLGGGSALVAVVLLGATSVALARSRAGPEVRLRVAVACGLGIMLLSSRLVWTHYYVLAVPAIVLALRAQATAWLAAAAIFLFTRVPSSAGPLASALAMNAATALLLVALGVQLLRASAETPGGPDPA